MGGASIARGLRLALVGLTLTLLGVMALGVAGLYGARADYEEMLAASYRLEAAVGELRAAGAIEQAATAAGSAGTSSRRARLAFDRAAGRARALAQGDARSLRLVQRRVSLQKRLRVARPARAQAAAGRLRRAARRLGVKTGDVTDALIARQGQRRDAARAAAADETRAAAITVGVAGLLTLGAAFLLVRDLTRRVRRPLDELVAATARVAGGDLGEGVSTRGPRELRELGEAFNKMSTDLRGAHDRIEHERRKLAVTIESLGDGLVVCDAAGRVTAFNPRAAQLVAGLAIGKPLDAEGGVLPAVEDAIGGETVIEAGGRSLAVTAARLETGSGGTVWTIRDITERVRLERMKSDFVAAASHELRSPLTSIKGFAELLERSGGLAAKQREAVEIIRASTDRLVDLVEELLEVARIEAGRVTIDAGPVSPATAVRNAAAPLAPRIQGKRQELAIELPPDLPPVRADARRLEQIVSNLLTNAHHYTGDGGRITVSCSARERDVEIAVSDTGRGMSGEELEHAFDRFYRGRAAGTLVPGTGLGLWIVKSLTELQGGSVDVTSGMGRGSVFRVRLPRADPARGSREATSAPPPPPAVGQRGDR